MPALLISTSMPPSASTASGTMRSMSARLAHVATRGGEAGDFLGHRGEVFRVDVADENLGAGRGEGAREFAADAGGTGGDQNPLHGGPYSSFSVVKYSGKPFALPRSVASLALVSATSRV